MTSPSSDRRQGLNGSAAIKVPCRAASTANLVLSGEQSVDGVALVTGDRCLVKNQTSSSANNGIYVVDTGSWTRDFDADGTYDFVNGTIVPVLYGTANGATCWQVVCTDNPIIIGASLLVFQAALFTLSSTGSFLASGTGAVARTAQAKMQDVVSVKDFGAKGDGVTDDTAAIQAAVNYVGGLGGGIVWLPTGTYVCNGLIVDWTHVLLQGETSGYDYEGQTTLAVQLQATSGTFCVHLKYDSTGGAQRKAFYSGLVNMAVNGAIEYGVVITSACTIMYNVTVKGFAYGITALGQNQNKYERVAVTNTTKIAFTVLDINNLSLTAPDLSFSDVHLVSSTIFTVRDCNFRAGQFGIVLRDGKHARFADCVAESNTQAALVVYKPTGVDLNWIEFDNCWFENNYSAYTSGSGSYSLAGIAPLLATSGHYLTGSVNGDWGSVADAGYQVWIGSQTEDYASGPSTGIYFDNVQLNCGNAQQRYARLRCCRNVSFRGGQWASGDGTNGLAITSYASYTEWWDFDSNNCNVTAIEGGTVGGNRSSVWRRGQSSAETGGRYFTQGDIGVNTGYGLQFTGTRTGAGDANTLDDYEEGTWTPALTAATPGDLAVTYGTRLGGYTKIGRTVHVWFDIVTSAFTWSTASGNFEITGLPFTASSVEGVCAPYSSGWTKAGYTQMLAGFASGSTFLNLLASGSGQARTASVIADWPSGGVVKITGSITYPAS